MNWVQTMQARIYETRYIEVNKAAQRRLAKADAENLCCACMQPHDGTRIIRGNHERCYRATMRAIEAGKTTDEERVAEGKLLEADPGGRKASNPVSAEFA